MKKLIFAVISAAFCLNAVPQTSTVYQKGITAEEGLKIIGALSPYVAGGYGFDNRYEGVRGTTRLSDTLLPSLLLIKGQKAYIQINSDIDLVQNAVLYLHPKTGQLFAVPVDIVEELIISKGEKDLVFRTTSGKKFEKELKEQKFIQVLMEEPVPFIRIPVKVFVQADYKNAYSADRRYDEYKNESRYYLLGYDNVFHQIQLARKSVLKLYPDKKKLISEEPDEKTFSNKEEMIISLISRF